MVQVSTRYSASRSAGESHAIIFVKIVVLSCFKWIAMALKLENKGFFSSYPVL